MSDEIEVRQEQEVAVPAYAAGSDLVLWAYEASQAHRMAISLCKTNFVPASMKGKPDDVAAAIMAGRELGLKPMATLKSMDVIQGVPALRAHAMRGLLQSHGHDVEMVEASKDHALVRARRRGSDKWQESLWTIDRAKAMGLTEKAEWKKQPQTMLTARATAEVCRLVASDVLHAMPYAAEEIDEPYNAGVAEVGQRVTAAEIANQGLVGTITPPTDVVSATPPIVIKQSRLRAYTAEEAATMEAKPVPVHQMPASPVAEKIDEFLADPEKGEVRERPTTKPVATLRQRLSPDIAEVPLPEPEAETPPADGWPKTRKPGGKE